MARPKKAEEPAKHFDVARPGTTAPSSSSKPIIVTHRPILQDPMVSGGEAKSPDGSGVKPAGRVTIKPISVEVNDGSEEKVKTDAPETEAGQAADSKPEPVQPEETPEPKSAEPETPEPEKPAEEAVAAEENTTDKPLETEPEKLEAAPADTEQGEEQHSPEEAADAAAKEAEKQAAEHAVAIAKLVENKEYFLPINSVESRKVKHFIIGGVVLVLILTIAWLDIALDAGLIQLGSIKPVTHFFKSSSPAPAAATKQTTTPKADTTASKTFTSTVDSLSFKYPDTWSVTNMNLTTSNEDQWVRPATEKYTGPASTLNSPVSVEFRRFSKVTATTNPLTLEKAQYTTLPNSAASHPLYLREIIWKSTSGKYYNVRMSITDSKLNEKAGDTTSYLETNFMATDGKTPLVLEALINNVKNGSAQPGFDNLSAAQAAMSSTDYQKAKNILLSLKLNAS